VGRRQCGRRWNCPESAAGPTPLYECGIGILCGVEVQPGTLGVLFQQALALEAAADALADQLNQLLQLAFVRCLDALKSGWSIVAIHIDAIQEQDMKVNVEVKGADPKRWISVTAPVAPSLSENPALWIKWVEIAR
jgi:hypothetical protein